MINGYREAGRIIGVKNEYGSTRILVDNSWSFELPDGMSYVVDSEPVKETSGLDLSGRGNSAYLLLHKGVNYDPEIEFVLKDNLDYPTVDDVRNDDSEETGYSSCVSYQTYGDEGDFIIGIGFYGVPFLGSLLGGCSRIRIRYANHRAYDFEIWEIQNQLEEAKELIRELVTSIRVEDRGLDDKPGEVPAEEEATINMSEIFLHAL